MKTIEELNKAITENLANKFDEIFIEALKRKGFEFDSKQKLFDFIKENIVCIDNSIIEQKTYKVKNIPFFIHNYKADFDLSKLHRDKESTITATYGTYEFI